MGNHHGVVISVQPPYNGFVNDVATFLITDNLNVIPNASGYTNLAFIQNSGIKSISSIKEMTANVTKEKEKVVTIGIKECLYILKASLTSTSALTNGLSHFLTDVKEEK
ncbi:hypothetical protein TSUD_163300 [Trifolium subterraneum]|uniref:Uncharacterized protein n=1 Tax=Trifolium subterraneum TaxID=3900 RepID=A0A2Z6N768_TRISU|nr:hypothetical protein TSUD_163300 [Trifolium subterraneum]